MNLGSLGVLSTALVGMLMLVGCDSEESSGGGDGNSGSSAGVTTNGELSVSPSSANFGSNGDSVSLIISTTSPPLDFVVNENSDWLSVSPTQGTLETETAVITAAANRNNLSSGTYSDSIQVISGSGQVEIPVTMTVASSNAAFSNQTKTTNGFFIEPKTCELSSTELVCKVAITNQEDSGWLTVYSGWNSSFTRIIHDGIEYKGDSVTITIQERQSTSVDLINNIPQIATISFTDMPTSITSLNVFELHFRDGRRYEGDYFSVLWSDIVVINKN